MASNLAPLAEQAAPLVESGLIVALPVALIAGAVSFASPCVLPLVPGYLSYVTSLSVQDLLSTSRGQRGRMVAGATLFVTGFSAVLISGGALFGYFGRTLMAYQDFITVILGVFTVAMGLAFMGVLPRITQREFRSHHRPVLGLAGAPLLGVVFGVGWTPCIGPTLAAVQAMAWNEASAVRGATLMLAYCVGLGLPFIVAALAFRRALTAFAWVKRHYQIVLRAGGGMLVLIGLLMITGLWNSLIYQLQVWAADSSAFL